ncbi:flagellar assembly protein FliX [Stappia sp. F7233]|uniref:Flagellar assembly protein FliX n=1 Tax=Stappia albiluteola TaxID=2758565 RepID=A0A839AKI4_9HYPH|nr:flagellar assembly protein FliX [Stappia albiluteola]MBA5779307.1 flagellar assembly protein FliX [Stappia albiluteola]
MRINGFTPVSNVQSRSQKRRPGEPASGFAPASTPETPASASTAAAASFGGIDALLALQEVEDPLAERKRAARHGRDLLDTLDQLKADLLAGRVAPDRLERLAAQLSRRKPGDDPYLEAILDEIDLRARVELAKLGIFTD